MENASTISPSADPREIARFGELAETWWDADGPFWPLHPLNRLRVGWIEQSLAESGMHGKPGEPLNGLRVVDVGCGGGILSESLARRGPEVLGIDVVEKNIGIARAHAGSLEAKLSYQLLSVEQLADSGATYDVVFNMEVVEHVAADRTYPGQLHVVRTAASVMANTLEKESVWDYPRPAICEPFRGSLRITQGGGVLAQTVTAYRTLETSHPPSYYFPPDDVDLSLLVENGHRSFCEWKGVASYFDLRCGDTTIRNAAWTYHEPNEPFRDIRDYLSFYASRVEACYVNDERVKAQEGDFYGGWITANLVGPFKGPPGTGGW